MKQLVFATGNKDKVREFKEILGESYEVLSMKELGVSPEIDENGETFEENALIKARALCQLTGKMAVSDDSGLVIDALNGEPGVRSARFMGEDTSYDIKNVRIIEMMSEYEGEKRSARFVCVIACVFPDGKEWVCRGEMEGRIGYEIKGENGFGYDPIFFLPEYGCSSAELSREEKNAISHRGKAMRMMRERLRSEGM